MTAGGPTLTAIPSTTTFQIARAGYGGPRPPGMGLAVGATLALYKYTFGQEALQRATGYTPGSEDDPTLKDIRHQYDLPGSNPLAEGEAVYEYRMGLQEGLRFNWHDQWG